MAYIVKIVTGSKSKCKDPFLVISLQGSKGAIMGIELNETRYIGHQHKLFSCGKETSFEIIHDFVGEINLVQIANRTPYLKDNDFCLESITVEDSSGTIFTFPCNDWLSPNKGDGRESRSLLRRPLVENKTFRKVWQRRYQHLDPLPPDLSEEQALALIQRFATPLCFINWGQTVRKHSVFAFFPDTIVDVQNVIRLALIAGLRVRSCGATHAWSDLYADEGQVLIDPQNMGPESERVAISSDRTKLTVMANATTLMVKEAQLQHKFTLKFNVILDSVTYGGTVNTGCHGVGRGQPALPDLVTELEAVNDQGDLVTYNEESTSAEFMKAVTTNLGLFGFVYKMTLEVKPREIIVETVNDFIKVSNSIADKEKLKQMVENNFSTEIFWFPFNSGLFDLSDVKKAKTLEVVKEESVKKALGSWDPLNDECWVRLINEKPGGRPAHEIYYFVQYFFDWLSHKFMRAITDVLAAHPHCNPAFTWMSHQALKIKRSTIVQELPHAIHYRKFINLAPVYDIEFAFPVDDDYENVVNACMAVVRLVQARAANGSFPLNICLEMRFMGPSESLLCPATVGQGMPNVGFETAYIEVLSLVNTPEWEDFCEQVTTAWRQIGGKENKKPLVHWAKETNPVTNFPQYLWDNNRENMAKFLAHLGSKVDMERRLFFNNFLEEIFFHPTA
ncbi:L-gulono-1,4-lactone dehydrogenase-like [Oscarella lobularis]|uniref:L-gulono-1,4-lactone dehydrogenase-like n=1 Tax=Oscarella lobularis TaxID=121494 RepID=UPI0033138C93